MGERWTEHNDLVRAGEGIDSEMPFMKPNLACMDAPKLNLAEIEKKARAAELQGEHVTRRTLKGLEVEDLEDTEEDEEEDE